MESKAHKLFLTRCDERPEGRMVHAAECGACPNGSVVDDNSRVICYGVTRFFCAPCYYDMKSSATVSECEACPWGVVPDDRSRVSCDRV